MAKLSTHRTVQLSELAYTARCEAAVNARAAANAASIGNRAAARFFIRRSSRLNLIGIKAGQRVAA
jgi:hypothetical protein